MPRDTQASGTQTSLCKEKHANITASIQEARTFGSMKHADEDAERTVAEENPGLIVESVQTTKSRIVLQCVAV